jgi:hypothetical protein
VLAAAWGSNLDESWRPIWREIGAFGLVSAVGLSTARKLHTAYRRRADQRVTEGLLTRRMASELFESDAPKRLGPDVERFFADFEENGTEHSDRRLGTAEHPPVRLFPLDPRSPESTQIEVGGVSAQVRNISLTGLGLVHVEPLTVGPMLLVYETRAGDRLVLGLHVTWCRPAGDGEYVSGGHFVEFSHTHPTRDESSELQAV